MSIIGFNTPLQGEHLAHSALPGAPVVPATDRPQRAHNLTAAALRAFARRTERLANRLDPVST